MEKLPTKKCPDYSEMTVRGQIGLIFDCSSSSHQEKSFDILDTSLHHLEAPQIVGTLFTPKKTLFCPYHVTHVTFYHFLLLGQLSRLCWVRLWWEKYRLIYLRSWLILFPVKIEFRYKMSHKSVMSHYNKILPTHLIKYVMCFNLMYSLSKLNDVTRRYGQK